MRQILDLADTRLEGLEHIYQRQRFGDEPDATVSLFADVVHAFSEIEAAIQQVPPALKDTDDLALHADALREGFRWMARAYEGTSDATPLVTLNLTVRPRFRAWHEALRRAIIPYLSS